MHDGDRSTLGVIKSDDYQKADRYQCDSEHKIPQQLPAMPFTRGRLGNHSTMNRLPQISRMHTYLAPAVIGTCLSAFSSIFIFQLWVRRAKPISGCVKGCVDSVQNSYTP